MQQVTGAFKFTRFIGIGEREHVRAGLLGVLFLTPSNIVDQITGAIRAADALGMMLRVHVNMQMFNNNERAQILNVFHLNAHHQFEPWHNLSYDEFSSLMSKVEMSIQRTDVVSTTPAVDVERGITSLWNASGGRFIKGNFEQRSLQELLAQYPQFQYDPEPFWIEWNG